jgi:hypothetical protein
VTAGDLLPRFLDFSAEVTAFAVLDLYGTGQAEAYLASVVTVVGEEVLGDLLDAWERAGDEAGGEAGGESGADARARARLLYRDVFSSEKLGPVARNIIKLWYAGVWYELPPEWTESFGPLENDVTFVVSPAAYTEGLLWRAIGANPSGARAPGYGSWAAPPRIPGTEDGGAPLTLAELYEGGRT